MRHARRVCALLATSGELLLYPLERFFARFEYAFELPSFDRVEDFAKFGAGLQPERDQIVSAHKRRRNNRLIRELFAFAHEEIVIVEYAMAAFAVDTVQLEFVLEGRSSHEAFELGHTHPRHIFEDHMLAHHLDRGINLRA